jgi:hypothetical protein
MNIFDLLQIYFLNDVNGTIITIVYIMFKSSTTAKA